MGQVSISLSRFQTLEADASGSDQIKSFTKTSDFQGIIVTKDVTLDYNYNPTTQILTWAIGAKHSLAAHMASDNIIDRHVAALIFNLVPVAVPESAASVEPEKTEGAS